MITIFDGMEKLTEEQLRFEIALLENVSVSAFASQTAQKAKKTSVLLANKLTSLVGGKQFAEPEMTPIADKVALSADALWGNDKEELVEHLRDCVSRKLEKVGVKDAVQLSSERQSVLAIAKAAEAVEGVSAYMTPLRKADAIAEKNRKIEVADFGITVMESKLVKELLAHVVMVCVQAYGEPFAKPESSLPGYLDMEAQDAYEAAEAKVWEAIAQDEQFHKECMNLEHAMEMCMSQAKTQESMYLSLEEKEGALLKKEAAADEEEALQKMLAETREKMEAHKEKQKALEEEYYAKQVELELLQQKNEEAAKQVEVFVAEKKQKLEERWANAYPALIYKDGVIGAVARTFRYQELLALEEAFAELTGADHAANLDEAPVDGRLYNVCKFYMEPGCAGRIAYRVKDNKILVLQVQKGK